MAAEGRAEAAVVRASAAVGALWLQWGTLWLQWGALGLQWGALWLQWGALWLCTTQTPTQQPTAHLNPQGAGAQVFKAAAQHPPKPTGGGGIEGFRGRVGGAWASDHIYIYIYIYMYIYVYINICAKCWTDSA